MQRVQRQLPAMLRRQHGLDRAEGGAVRAQSTCVGNQCLFRRIRHKAAILTNPEAETDDLTA
jgi:hypothetical protein